MSVHQIVNDFHTSNTFIVELSVSKVLLIDVGNFSQIEAWLKTNKKEVEAVILTHEHSDHCHGVNALYKVAPFDLYCSSACLKNIANSRQNFSLYIEDLEEFEIRLPDANIIKDMEVVDVLGNLFTCIETPGHSPGSICVLNDDNLFTGDTILNGIKTPLNLPHSDRLDYSKSIKKLKNIIKKEMTIFPGHDNPFKFQNFDKLVINK